MCLIMGKLFSVCACWVASGLCLTLCYPMDCSPPDSSVHGILQARVLDWVAMPSPRGSSWPRGWTHPHLLCLLHCQADSLSLSHLGSPTTQRFHQRHWRNMRHATLCSQHIPWESTFGYVPILGLFYLSLSLSGLKLPSSDTLFSGLNLPEISLHLAE